MRTTLIAVCAGLLVNGNKGCGHAIELAVHYVLEESDFCFSHILQVYDGAAVPAPAQDDIVVLCRILEGPLRYDGKGQLDRTCRGLLADLPRPEELVLGRHGLLDV